MRSSDATGFVNRLSTKDIYVKKISSESNLQNEIFEHDVNHVKRIRK